MKKWKETTRDGTKVRIYAEDGGGKFPIQGAVFGKHGWILNMWKDNGRFSDSETDHPHDLILDRREVWVNEYPDGVFGCSVHGSLDKARKNASDRAIGTVKFVEVLSDE